MVQEFILIDQQATIELGQKIAQLQTRPILIYIHGELGAGKTTLVQGLIKALIGEHKRVLSPTYAYVQSYQHTPIIHHFDLYRIDDPEQIKELGLDIMLADEKSIRLIEWPERLGSLESTPDLDIHLINEGHRRKAIINS